MLTEVLFAVGFRVFKGQRFWAVGEMLNWGTDRGIAVWNWSTGCESESVLMRWRICIGALVHLKDATGWKVLAMWPHQGSGQDWKKTEAWSWSWRKGSMIWPNSTLLANDLVMQMVKWAGLEKNPWPCEGSEKWRVKTWRNHIRILKILQRSDLLKALKDMWKSYF